MDTIKIILAINFWIVLSLLSFNTNAQNQSNIQKFEKDVAEKITSEISFKGYDFEGFNICIKVNSIGKIDTAVVSLSTIPQLRDRLNKLINTLDFKNLLLEVQLQKWKNVNIVIPVLVLYESYSKKRGFGELVDYAKNRLDYFSMSDIIAQNDYLTNCILLKTLVFVKTEAIR